jgi:hypothetical protein
MVETWYTGMLKAARIQHKREFQNVSCLWSEISEDNHWTMMASENPTLNNRGSEMLRGGKQASIMTVKPRQLTELVS